MFGLSSWLENFFTELRYLFQIVSLAEKKKNWLMSVPELSFPLLEV